MSDSGLTIEAENEPVQPTESVADEVEATEATPLADDTDAEEFEVTIAADQSNEGDDGKEIDYRAMALAKAEKAKKERDKRKAEEDARKAAESELETLKAQVAELRAGPKPSIADYYDDEEGYHAALSEWEAKRKPKPPETKQSNQATQEVPVAIMTYQYESEDKMRSQDKGYDQKADSLREKMANQGMNPDAALAALADACIGADVDYATAIIGLNGVPGALESVASAAAANSMGLVQKHIRDAAKKVKISRRQKIETKPEPSVSSTGGIESGEAALAVLRKKWVENPRDKAATDAYFSAKRKVKANG